MANSPKQKYFGNISLDGVKKAFSQVPGKVNEYKGEKQLKVSASQWDDGNISIDLWDGEKKESIRIGSLRVSTLDNNTAAAAPQPASTNTDLPF